MLRIATGAVIAVGTCLTMAGNPARADVIYTFTTTQATNTRGSQALPVTLIYDLSNAVVEAGSFTLSSPGNNGGPPFGPLPVFSGDANGFTSLNFITGEPDQNDLDNERVTPTYLYGSIRTALTFDAVGDVTSSSVDYLGVNNEVHLAGTGATATGYGASDANVCFGGNPGGACSVTGVWTESGFPGPSSVPEPATFAVLAAAVLGLAGFRWAQPAARP